MPSNVSEAAAVLVAVGATTASIFLAAPPTLSTASTLPGRGLPRALSSVAEPTRLARPADVSPDEAAEDFTVNESAFMPATGRGRLRVGSFNMLHVGARADKDYERLARIVEQFDLCGVLELEREQALRDLTEALGAGWGHVVSEREAGDPERPGTFELYGFVFRTSKVVPLDGPTGFFPDPDGIFSREPYFASFRAESFDFTMALLHAESPGNSANLTKELEQLPEVFRFLQDLDPNENDVLLAGDFNRSPSSGAGNPTGAWQPFLALPQMDCVIPDDVLTSLSSKPTGFANHYDEICLTLDQTREFTGERGAFDFVLALFEGQNDPAKRFVSDHLPVWADFRIDQPDDDGVARPATSASAGCCKICRTSKPCGDTCIPRELNCSRPAGCACSP